LTSALFREARIDGANLYLFRNILEIDVADAAGSRSHHSFGIGKLHLQDEFISCFVKRPFQSF